MQQIENTINGHKLLLKVMVGSQAYGTSTPQSDVDFKGIFMQNPLDILNGKYTPQINVTDDEVYYEIQRFLELLQSNNPTILEMLFVPKDCIVYYDNILDDLFKNRMDFISKKARNSFGGYAIQQIAKSGGLSKKMNMKKEDMQRKGIIDFCYVIQEGFNGSVPLTEFCEKNDIKQTSIGLTNVPHLNYVHQMYIDSNNEGWAKGIVSENGNESNEVRTSSIPKGATSVGFLSFNKDAYQRHCKEYREYTEWDKKKNVQRYTDIGKHGQSYDGKNLLHCVRLIDMGIEIAQGLGVIVRRPNAEYLLSIRKGIDIDYPKLIEECNEKIKLMDETFEVSTLPNDVDVKSIEFILNKIRIKQIADLIP